MYNIKKFHQIYKDILSLQPEYTLYLVLEAETEEEKLFYELIADFLLQIKQKKQLKIIYFNNTNKNTLL